ncbi:hypothetical protein QTP88_011390 [Uroleucon formosanum]
MNFMFYTAGSRTINELFDEKRRVEEEKDGGGGCGGGCGGRASDFAAFVQPSGRRLISELIQYNATDVNSVAASRFGVLLMSVRKNRYEYKGTSEAPDGIYRAIGPYAPVCVAAIPGISGNRSGLPQFNNNGAIILRRATVHHYSLG